MAYEFHPSSPEVCREMERRLREYWDSIREPIERTMEYGGSKLRLYNERAGHFNEGWNEGDPAFGPTDYTMRLGWNWEIHPEAETSCFRLAVWSDRFSLELPYVTDAIR